MRYSFLYPVLTRVLSKSSVAVMDNQGNLLSEQGEDSGAAGVAGQMMKAYEAQERRLEQKIETMLCTYCRYRKCDCPSFR